LSPNLKGSKIMKCGDQYKLKYNGEIYMYINDKIRRNKLKTKKWYFFWDNYFVQIWRLWRNGWSDGVPIIMSSLEFLKKNVIPWKNIVLVLFNFKYFFLWDPILNNESSRKIGYNFNKHHCIHWNSNGQ